MTAIAALAHGKNHNQSTKYEVEVIINGKRKIAGYTARKTKMSLLEIVLDNDSLRAEILSALSPEDDDIPPCYNARTGWDLGNTLIRWTGGTARNPA